MAWLDVWGADAEFTLVSASPDLDDSDEESEVGAR